MAKPREEDTQPAGGEARIRPQWVATAQASRHTKRPVKLQTNVDEDVKRRVELAALVEGLDFGQVITGLVKTHLVGYYAGVRGGSKDEAA